jgi:hypothetical protein
MAEVKLLIIAEVGAARLEVCVADITTLKLDAIVNAANQSCSAVAASTAPSTAPPGRICWRSAGHWAGARPARQRSHAAIGFPPGM